MLIYAEINIHCAVSHNVGAHDKRLHQPEQSVKQINEYFSIFCYMLKRIVEQLPNDYGLKRFINVCLVSMQIMIFRFQCASVCVCVCLKRIKKIEKYLNMHINSVWPINSDTHFRVCAFCLAH